MTVRVELASGARAKDLILQTYGGTLSQAQLGNIDYCIAMSSKLWLGFADGELACSWGLVPATILSDDKAYLWLHSTPRIQDHLFLFVRHSQRMVERMLEEYPVIHGMTDPQNDRTVRWLKWLGAEFGEPLAEGMPFFIRKK